MQLLALSNNISLSCYFDIGLNKTCVDSLYMFACHELIQQMMFFSGEETIYQTELLTVLVIYADQQPWRGLGLPGARTDE